MEQFLFGIFLFFGIHSVSMAALSLRNILAVKSELGWKSLYSIISLVGIVLMARGYADLKQTTTLLYVLPDGFRYLSAVLLLPVFILLFAPYFPGRIKSATKHPQLVAVILWAVAHLLLNGTSIGLILFGSFLLWAIANRVSMNNRDTRPVPGAPASSLNDIILVIVGLACYIVTIFWLHQWLFGTSPLA